MNQNNGLVHLYFGDGKGKTTAAVGLCVRAAGAGKRVLFAQVLKDGKSSEITPLVKLGIEMDYTLQVDKFLWLMTPQEKTEYRERVRGWFFGLGQKILDGGFDLVVLDEIVDTISCEILTEQEMIEFIREKPSNIELVLTGHQPPQTLVDRCDYVSEIKAIRHPFEKGVTARVGIEF